MSGFECSMHANYSCREEKVVKQMTGAGPMFLAAKHIKQEYYVLLAMAKPLQCQGCRLDSASAAEPIDGVFAKGHSATVALLLHAYFDASRQSNCPILNSSIRVFKTLRGFETSLKCFTSAQPEDVLHTRE